MAAAMAIVHQCNTSSERVVNISTWQRDLDEEKQDVIQELDELSDAIEEQLNDIAIASKVATANEHIRESTDNVERRLLVEKGKIKKATRYVRASSENTWDDVRDDVRKKVIDVKIEVLRVREKIRNEISINN